MQLKKFAFYGRVASLEDVDIHRKRQIWSGRALIQPYGGEIVAEFFDAGVSRRLPWEQRPQAAALLDCFRTHDRGFEAVVVESSDRTFSTQFWPTFPLFVRYGIELWAPEFNGPIDSSSEPNNGLYLMSLVTGELIKRVAAQHVDLDRPRPRRRRPKTVHRSQPPCT